MSDFNITPSVSPSDKYTKLNDFELISLFMESDSGGKVDLKNIYQNLSFVEDIDSSAISGSVLIKDGVDLLNTFPISGHESITLEFRTPGIDSDFIKLKFKVVEVTDRVRSPNERGEVYRLRFVSPSAVKNKSTKISKSFKGKISDIAKTIYNEYIGGSLDTQATKNEQKFVIPRWSPFKAIEWLALRSIPAKRSDETNYFFFETVDGHRFVTLSQLCSEESIITYFQIPVGFRGGDSDNMSRNFSNVKDVRLIKVNQKLQEHMDGAFSSVLYQHDVTTKQWGRKVYNYNTDTGVRHITDNRVTKNDSIYTTTPDINFNLTTKQTGLMGGDYPNVQNHEDWFQRSLSEKSLLDTIKIRIQVAGNSLLRVGRVVEFFTPKAAALKTSDTEWYDSRLSGKYLVTTLRHTLSPDGYTNTMILAKNSYEVSLADQSTFMGTSKQSESNLVEKR